MSDSGPRPLTPSDLPAGTMIDGKYRVESVLGQGGMGLVVAAEHVQLRERVALKFLRADGDTAAGFRSRFKREAQICARIKNEHITRVIDIGAWRDADYMVMEHLAGTDLRGHMRANGPLALEQAIDFGLQICDGLAEVHARGVVHRDLKPSNLFVTKRADGTPLIKILDFGISKWAADADAQDDELTKTGAVLGSPKYMAPEQLFGSNSVDARADVWSVGAIIYEMLTGKPPFDEPTFARLCARLSSGVAPTRPRERRPELSEELDAAVMLCLEPNVGNRLPNVAVLAGELLAATGQENAEAVRTRLQSVLDGGVSPLSSSGSLSLPLKKSGEYVAASLSLSRTGSAPGLGSKAPPSLSQSGATQVAVSQTPLPSAAPEPQRRKALVPILLVAAVLLGIVASRLAFRRDEPAAASQPPATSSAPVAASTATMAAPTHTAAPSTAPTETVAATATAATVDAAPTTAPTHHAALAGKPHAGSKSEPKATATAATTAAAAPTPTPAPAPTPTTAPTPTAKPNPLEDRQ